jgi:hypothetical protein
MQPNFGKSLPAIPAENPYIMLLTAMRRWQICGETAQNRIKWNRLPAGAQRG